MSGRPGGSPKPKKVHFFEIFFTKLDLELEPGGLQGWAGSQKIGNN